MTKRKKVKSSKRKKKIPQAKNELSQERETKDVEKELSDETGNLGDLARDIVVSYDNRVKVVGEIVEDTHRIMNDFRGKRENMSKELRELLSKSESLRRKDFDRMMADIVLKQNEREEQVKKMLADFRKEEEMVAEKLRNLLKKGEGIRIKDFKEMMVEIKKEQDRRVKETSVSVANELQNMREEVYKMLDNFKKERRSAATAWHEILGFFSKEKAEVKPAGPAPEPLARYGAGNPGNESSLGKEKSLDKSN